MKHKSSILLIAFTFIYGSVGSLLFGICLEQKLSLKQILAAGGILLLIILPTAVMNYILYGKRN